MFLTGLDAAIVLGFVALFCLFGSVLGCAIASDGIADRAAATVLKALPMPSLDSRSSAIDLLAIQSAYFCHQISRKAAIANAMTTLGVTEREAKELFRGYDQLRNDRIDHHADHNNRFIEPDRGFDENVTRGPG